MTRDGLSKLRYWNIPRVFLPRKEHSLLDRGEGVCLDNMTYVLASLASGGRALSGMVFALGWDMH